MKREKKLISDEALRRVKRRITGAYLAGHSVVHLNTSYKSLGEQFTAYQLEKMEAQTTSDRYDRQQRLLIQKTIEDMDREVTERRDTQRAMRPGAPIPPEGELRDAIDDIIEVTMVCRELDAAMAKGREPSAEALAVLARWRAEIQEEDDELELDAAKAAFEDKE
jgi:hypothetical protein